MDAEYLIYTPANPVRAEKSILEILRKLEEQAACNFPQAEGWALRYDIRNGIQEDREYVVHLTGARQQCDIQFSARNRDGQITPFYMAFEMNQAGEASFIWLDGVVPYAGKDVIPCSLNNGFRTSGMTAIPHFIGDFLSQYAREYELLNQNSEWADNTEISGWVEEIYASRFFLLHE